MAFVPAPGICEVDIIWNQAGQHTQNTFHYRKAATGPSDLIALCNTALADIAAHWTGLLSTHVSVVEAYARDLSSQNSWTVTQVPTAPIVGTDATELHPNNVSFAVKRQTGLAGRKMRGRVYWPGIPDDFLTETNTMDTVKAGDLTIVLTGLMTQQVTDNAAQEVILHKATGIGTNVIGYVTSDFTLDSQRRRLPGHNIHH